MVVELCVQNSHNYTIRKMKTNCVDDVSHTKKKPKERTDERKTTERQTKNCEFRSNVRKKF